MRIDQIVGGGNDQNLFRIVVLDILLYFNLAAILD
jgi:hypothetical protein